MGIILRVLNGPGAGRRMYLRSGQMMKIGRTQWADFSIPQDASLGEVHFALLHGIGSCLLRDLNAAGGTLLNGQPVVEAPVRHGDQITAGKSTFMIHVEGPSEAATPGGSTAADGSQSDDLTSGFKHVAIVKAEEVCRLAKFTPPALALLTPAQITREFLELLLAQKMFADAIRFLACALPKREGVWWAIGCVRMASLPASENDANALAAAEAWTLEPSEEHRWSALLAGKATKYRTPHGWAAIAAGWSGGSTTPPHFPVVAPKETATSQAVAITATLCGAKMNPQSPLPVKMGRLLEAGVQVADGVERWPETPAGKA